MSGRAFAYISLLILVMSCREKNEPLFLKIAPAESGIRFENNNENAPKEDVLSPLDYLYYYNGAGVASGDFNNDGLIDLFFVSNRGANRLYINEGNFRFRDITDSAGVAGFAQWKTGVTLADVNGDGLLDIYVCALSNYKDIEGSNELYINRGDNTFEEKAADYGLDYSGMATQSSFFDFDRDGDLDMYLATHGPNNSRAYDRVMATEVPSDLISVDRFFRNDNGVFVDISKEAGINGPGHSLGLAVADLNNDGWEDIYVTNDFYENDHCYINQKDGTFRDEASTLFAYHSRYAHGCDLADLDNDGYPEVMTADIAFQVPVRSAHTEDPWDVFIHKKSYDYALQFSRNCLQKNEAGKVFTELGAFAGVAATGWSWSVLLADFNNDGRKDLFTSTGIPKRLNDIDFLEFAHKDSLRYSETLTPVQVRRILETLPDGKSGNRMFENNGRFHFTDQSQAWGIEEQSYSNGAVYADLDSDGDLDVVINNFYGPPSLFKNQTREKTPERHFISVRLTAEGSNTQASGAKIFVKTADGFQMQQVTATRGFLSSMEGPLHFGVGASTIVDSLIVVWVDGKTQVLTSVRSDQQITIDKKEARTEPVTISLFKALTPMVKEIPLAIDFQHRENAYYDFYRESLVPFLTSREGPALAVADVNGDGLEDFYVGGAKHQSGAIYLQKENGSFVDSRQPAFDEKIFEDVDAVFADVDNDGDQDLYVVSGGNEFYNAMRQQTDRLYINDGKGKFEHDRNALPVLLQNKSCARPTDIDNDGDIDFFIGGRIVPFHYGKPAPSFILINDGHGKFTDGTKQSNESLLSLGMVTDAQWGDLDGDGDADLVVVGEWMPVRVFLNHQGMLREMPEMIGDTSPITNINGLWQCVSLADIDNDGDLDIVAGNLGLNSSLRTNDTTALRLMTGVTSDNGKKGPLMIRMGSDGHYYPVPGWLTLRKAMPERFLKSYPTANTYDGVDWEELASELKLQWDATLTVDQLASLVFENINGKEFIARELPDEMQYSSIYAIDIRDVNGDHSADLVTAGNTLNVSPDQGAYMGSMGCVATGDHNGFFKPMPSQQSGLMISGEVRNIRTIRIMNRLAWLFARNNDSLKVFQLQASTANAH